VTARLLISCGANVDVLDSNKNTSLHILVQHGSIPDVVIMIIDILCNSGAHLDQVNSRGQTPLELIPSFQNEIIQYLKEKIGVRQLKCICARLIQKECLLYKDFLSISLTNFVQKH
jgi:Fem-1 family protein b